MGRAGEEESSELTFQAKRSSHTLAPSTRSLKFTPNGISYHPLACSRRQSNLINV